MHTGISMGFIKCKLNNIKTTNKTSKSLLIGVYQGKIYKCTDSSMGTDEIVNIPYREIIGNKH